MRTSSMICPKCGDESRVYVTQRQEGSNTILRYRKCKKCDYHFTTLERIMKNQKEN